MEQVWEWRSANPDDWQQLTDSFYKAVSSSAVCAVGIINERYKEFRVQLVSAEKSYFAYLQQGPSNLRVGVKAESPDLSDLSELTDIVHVIGNGLSRVQTAYGKSGLLPIAGDPSNNLFHVHRISV